MSLNVSGGHYQRAEHIGLNCNLLFYSHIVVKHGQKVKMTTANVVHFKCMVFGALNTMVISLKHANFYCKHFVNEDALWGSAFSKLFSYFSIIVYVD